jgi:hypothetical protein
MPGRFTHEHPKIFRQAPRQAVAGADAPVLRHGRDNDA